MKCYYCNKKAHASGTIAIGREMCADHIEQYWSGLKLPKKKEMPATETAAQFKKRVVKYLRDVAGMYNKGSYKFPSFSSRNVAHILEVCAKDIKTNNMGSK